jgi:hypothetical protein
MKICYKNLMYYFVISEFLNFNFLMIFDEVNQIFNLYIIYPMILIPNFFNFFLYLYITLIIFHLSFFLLPLPHIPHTLHHILQHPLHPLQHLVLLIIIFKLSIHFHITFHDVSLLIRRVLY